MKFILLCIESCERLERINENSMSLTLR